MTLFIKGLYVIALICVIYLCSISMLSNLDTFINKEKSKDQKSGAISASICSIITLVLIAYGFYGSYNQVWINQV